MARKSPQITIHEIPGDHFPDLEALSLVFSNWRDQIAQAYQNGEILTAKKLLAQFVQKIELDRQSAIIHYVHPLSNSAECAENARLLCAHLFFGGLLKLEITLE